MPACVNTTLEWLQIHLDLPDPLDVHAKSLSALSLAGCPDDQHGGRLERRGGEDEILALERPIPQPELLAWNRAGAGRSSWDVFF